MSDKRKAVFVVMDGVGDRPLQELGGKTPLQVAKTPVFDRLAKEWAECFDECHRPRDYSRE